MDDYKFAMHRYKLLQGTKSKGALLIGYSLETSLSTQPGQDQTVSFFS